MCHPNDSPDVGFRSHRLRKLYRLQISDDKLQMSTFRLQSVQTFQTLQTLQTSDLGLRILEFRFEKPDFRFQLSDFRFQASDFMDFRDYRHKNILGVRKCASY